VGLLDRLAGASLAVSLASLAAPAGAQIVNVQPLIAAKEPDDGLSLVAEGSADLRNGNTRLTVLSGNAIAELRSGRHLGFVLVRGDFGARAGEPFLNKDLEHARYRITLTGPLEAEAFAQHDRDDFRRLALRALLGAGPRLRLRPFDGFDASAGAALMLEHERLGLGPEPDAGQQVLVGRLSTYLFLATTITPQLRLGNTIYLQPRLDRSGDVRVLGETSLLATATEHVSVKMSLTSAFDSEPPVGVVPLDSTLKGALQLSF
jgi:Protein of unknown function, DUF481